LYSRNTDRGGRRIKLPPGYDGSTFRHDTGEIRRLAEETDMKIHSPDREASEPEINESPIPEKERRTEAVFQDAPVSIPDGAASLLLPVQKEEKRSAESFLEGLLKGLGSEEWLLFLLILLLAADGNDCWDAILLLGLLLAVSDK